MGQVKYKSKFKMLPNKVELFKFFSNRVEGFDLNGSLRMYSFDFLVKGKYHKVPSLYHFLESMKEEFKLDVDFNKSRQSGASFIVIFDGDVPAEINVNTVTSVIKEEEVLTTVEVDAPISEDSFSKEYAESLYTDSDKKGSKKKLEVYLRGFDYEVDKRSNFQASLERFIEEQE